MSRIVAECCECGMQSETGEEFHAYFGGSGVCKSCEERIEDEESHPELTRLLAIESAAREYRTAWESDATGDRERWQISCRVARVMLFALLGPRGAPPND